MRDLNREVWSHWQDNLALAKEGKLESEHICADNCAYCQVFLNHKSGVPGTCHGCPIHKFTGEHLCDCTPWVEVMQAAMWTDIVNQYIAADRQTHAVETEIAFLAKIIPPEDQVKP